MTIAYSDIACELREVVLKNKPIEMLNASPKGTVPVLVDGERVIDESIDVMSWALRQSDPHGWLDHPLNHQVIERNDGEFKFYLDRYKYSDRYPEQSQSWYFDHAMTYLHHLESILLSNDKEQYFLESSQISVLDIAIFPFVRQFAFVDKTRFDNQDLPRLKSWLDFFLSYSGFLKVMNKVPMWTPDQSEEYRLVAD